MTNQLRLWAMCCSHVGTDLKFGRESLADAIRQSERGGDEGGTPFEWDVAVVLVGEEVLLGRGGGSGVLCGGPVLQNQGAPDRVECFFDRRDVGTVPGVENPTHRVFL